MKKPNAILLGVHKAGTSSFFNWLSQHPDVYAPEEMKDFPFFIIDKFYNKGIKELSKYFASINGEKIGLHGAVQYIYFPIVAKRIYEFNPETKLILILRNPVKRAFSAHQYLYKLGVESLPFLSALEREETENFQSIEDRAKYKYLDHGFYFKQLQEYLKYFKKEQIQIFIYEEMLQQKEVAVAQTCRFLEIDAGFQPNFAHLNKTNSPRFRWINQMVFGENGLKTFFRKYVPILQLMPLSWKAKFGNRLREINTQTKNNLSISQEVIDKYTPIFVQDIEDLSRFLNKAKKLFKQGSVLNQIYYGLPFKKEVFALLKSTNFVSEKWQWYLRFKGSFKVVIDKKHSFRMYHPGFYIENNLFWQGFNNCWEKESLRLWQLLAREATTIFDVGANTGTYSMTAKAVNPKATVVAFEPLPRMINLIQKNANLNNFDIEICPAAVSDFDGKATFYDAASTDGDVSSASLSQEFQYSEQQKPIEVTVCQLSTWIKKQKIKRVDLLKIDVETFEPQALKGLQPYLEEFKPSMIIEILEDNIAIQIEEIIAGMGYLFFDIDDEKGVKRVNKLKKSTHFNYLLCQEAVAKKLQLI